MKRLASFLAASTAILVAAAARAQDSPLPGGPRLGPMYAYGHMWGDGWGWHMSMFFGLLLALFAFVGIVVSIAWLVRWLGHGVHHGHGDCPRCSQGRASAALGILEERLARGEIGKDEFHEKRQLLSR